MHMMASDSSSGIEFHSCYSNYSLLPQEEKTTMAHRSRREASELSPLTTGSAGDLLQQLAKIGTEGLNKIKIFLAGESTNGENYCESLKPINAVLERILLSGITITDSSSAHIQSIYNMVTEKLISFVPKVKQSQKAMALLLTDSLCLLSALNMDSCLTFPEVFASCLLYFQPEAEWGDLYHKVVAMLCRYILPSYFMNTEYCECLCLTSVLMMVLEACSSTKHHLLLVDTLMSLKRNVCLDILKVITYGTHTVRPKALDLLLHYWPIPIPEFRPHSHKLTYGEWEMPLCENSTCHHSNNVAATLCLDVSCAIQHKAQSDTTSFFMLLCPDCDSSIHNSSKDTHQRLKLPTPLREIKPNCEFQRMCLGEENNVNRAVVTCYNDSCTVIQNGQPLRMCHSCHSKQHKELDDPTHIYQVGLPDPWVYDNLSSSSTMLEAISKLLEAIPVVTDAPARPVSAPRISSHLIQRVTKTMLMIKIDMSQKAIWLLSHYGTPTTEVRVNQQEWLIHLLAKVLEWMQTFYDILQEAIVKLEEQLTSAGVALVAAGAEGQEWVDSGNYISEFEKMFTNYSDVTKLIDSHVLYWVRSVCDTNSACMVQVLSPDIPGCAQVGRMWNKAHDSISRYKRTLMKIRRLDYFHRQGKLDSFSEIFTAVMPLWMDKLIDLRADPGKMQGLQDQFRLIFSTQDKKHEQGLRIFQFIREKFWSENSEDRQKGLFWLQDLTRLRIPLPYLPHMFDDALKETRRRPRRQQVQDSPMSSFDQGMEGASRKESTESGSDVEPHLLSQSSMEQIDAQVILNFKSSLARYILMLDIWLSQLTQLPEVVPTLELSVFQGHLIKMLGKVWGSTHNHTDSNTTCYLCHSVGVWFGLATRLLEEYNRLGYREGSAGEEMEESATSPIHQMNESRLRQLAHSDTQDSSPQASPPREEEPGNRRPGVRGGLRVVHDADEREYDQHGPLGHKQRKVAQVQSHSEFRVVSDKRLPLAPSQGEESQRESTPSTYKIFQLCARKLERSNLQPSALLKVIGCLLTLVQDWRVLGLCDDIDTICNDVSKLFETLWKSLDTNSSNTDRACVELLLECAIFLADKKPVQISREPKGVFHSIINLSDSEEETEDEKGQEVRLENQLLWTTLHSSLSSTRWASRFKAAGAITMVVQFMRKMGSSENDVLKLDLRVQASLAHGFCLLVQLLIDKNSSVCARAKYLIATIKEDSLDAMKLYLKNFFIEYPAYCTEVLSTLSLLDSTLPELAFLSVDILTYLLTIPTKNSPCIVHVEEHPQPGPKKKVSDVSVLVGGVSPKISTLSMPDLEEDPVKLKITEKILSLLLRHIANPRADISEFTKKNQGQKSKKGGTVRGRRSTSSSSVEDQLFRIIRITVFHDLHCLPQQLRKNPVFEVFLNHMFPVLDHNIAFGQTKGLLPFILKLLCFCAAPSQSDYVQLKLDERLREPHIPLNPCSYSLSSLPPHLQAPWLRIFFVILYKYIHVYSEVDPGSHYQGLEMLTLTQWCLQITLNTLESEGHKCSLSNAKKKPSLQRQFPIDSFTHSIMESLVRDDSMFTDESSSPSIVKSKSRDLLTPVPEDSESQHNANTVESSKVKEPEDEPVEAGLCIICRKPTNEYSEEVIALATVAVGTCCHRLPHIVSGLLVSKIIPAVARVVVPGSFLWQSTKTTAEPPPGSAITVAKHILSSILTQFGDRRLFLFLFGTDFGPKSQTVFSALAQGLVYGKGETSAEGGEGDKEDELTQSAVIKYFLLDAISSVKDLHPQSIVNLVTYIESLDDQIGDVLKLTKDLLLWDSFFKKLKSNTNILRHKKTMHSLLRLIIMLFKNSLEHPTQPNLGNYHAHIIQGLIGSIMAILEFALYNVYVPLGGLVELCSVWYRLFQKNTHRDAEKLIKFYVSELRKALKARDNSDQCPRQDNILGLIQVLILEESGYLGYVDGLTTKKYFAPDLKLVCEIHSQPVITAMQWDFIDVLNYLCAVDVSKNSTSIQLVAQLKLSLGQLIALRVQHGGVGHSPPTDNLRRLISGDPRALLPAPTTFRSTVIHVLQLRWQDYVKAVHIFTWILLGAMSHNYIDGIAADMKMSGSVGGQCRLLESLNHKLDEVTNGILSLANGVIQKLADKRDGYFGYLYLTLLFASTWTVYMELYAKDSMALIIEFWQKFIGKLTNLMSGDVPKIYQKEVVQTVNKYVAVRIKEINLSCYQLLVPIWSEITTTTGDVTKFPNIEEARKVCVDAWLRETINEILILEQEWQTEILY